MLEGIRKCEYARQQRLQCLKQGGSPKPPRRPEFQPFNANLENKGWWMLPKASAEKANSLIQGNKVTAIPVLGAVKGRRKRC